MADKTPEELAAEQKAAEDAAKAAAAPPMAVVDVNDLREALRGTKPEGPTGKNASTDPEKPAEHYFLAADGKTKVNAYGEEKGSAEDKRRMAALGYANL
jgi:hypothetical protein